jgi:hypothetical protein
MRSTDFPFAVTPQGYAVRRFDKGGPSFADRARTMGQGLSFGTSDEVEAFLRSLMSKQSYRGIKTDIEGQREAYRAANPTEALALEMGGAFVPGLAGAFIPGGQGATLGALGRAARVMDAPVAAMLARLSPAALKSLQARLPGRLAVGVADEMLTGAVQSVGKADTTDNITRSIVEDAPLNAVASLGVRGGTEGVKAFRARRAKKRG